MGNSKYTSVELQAAEDGACHAVEEKTGADVATNRLCRSLSTSSLSESSSYIKRFFTTNLLNDEELLRAQKRLLRTAEGNAVEGLIVIKLIKFWTCALLGIVATHHLARWMGWEIDDDYNLSDFFLHDFTAVLLDLFFFFFVGRLHDSQSVDVLFPWGLFVAAGCAYASLINNFSFLQHSVSMYEVMCLWPLALFFYAAALAIMAVTLIVATLKSHYRRGVLPSRCLESLALLCLFILPFATRESFHLHHWYGMWFVGMQCTAPTWWSRSFQAYCLGSYINGIAVYGRDPIFGCKFAYYRSTNLQCNFMDCYRAAAPGNETLHHYQDFLAPDWRTCNA